MMVKDMTKFPKCHLGSQGMLGCVSVCVQGYTQDFEGGLGGGTPKFSIDLEGVYST